MSVTILRADALALPLGDASVDLIVTSPPYFALRSYTDGGRHYNGQLGSEDTPAEFLDALIAATREMVRVLKPAGSLWVNLGDKYASYEGGRGRGRIQDNEPRAVLPHGTGLTGAGFVRSKSLMGLPWRYAIRCIDELGLILRAEVIWSMFSLACAIEAVQPTNGVRVAPPPTPEPVGARLESPASHDPGDYDGDLFGDAS